MPFVARCVRCGYVESALSRWLLTICMEGHDRQSHGDHPIEDWTGNPLTWVVAIVSKADFYMIQRLSKIPTFWEAQRLPKGLQIKVANQPLISGLVSGEFKPFCKLNEQSQRVSFQPKQMVRVLSKQKTQATVPAVVVPQEVVLLRGFRDLVGERYGYFVGRRLTQQEMNEKTEAERKAVSEVRKTMKDNLEKYIKDADIKTYMAKKEALKSAAETLTNAAKPFRAKISPLAKAQRYLDNVAIPDALKELGTPVQPRFGLSKWINDAIEASKKKK